MELDIDDPQPDSSEGIIEPKIYGNKDYLDAETDKRIMARIEQFCFICYLCGKKFGKRVLALQHVKLIHHRDVKVEDRSEPPECKVCGKVFTQSNNLYRHMRSTHGIQPPPKRVNDAKKGEACPLCNRLFATINTVNIHVRKYHKFALHSKRAPTSSNLHPCEFCDLAFPEESTCSSHMRNYHYVILQSNSKEEDGKLQKIYQCAVCNEDFIDRANLKTHLLEIHQKDLRENAIEMWNENEEEEDKEETRETLNCDGCGMSFGEEHEWISHMEDEHKAIPAACCRRCGDFSSKTIYDLKCHMEKVHSETLPEETPAARPRKSGTLNLTRQELLAMERIPSWLVKHGKGQALVVLQRDL